MGKTEQIERIKYVLQTMELTQEGKRLLQEEIQRLEGEEK